jgi:hypothetical protein
MPHVNEYEEIEEAHRGFFLRREDIQTLMMNVGDSRPFDVDGIRGEVSLIEVEVKQYGWGGCGNNIGTGARVHVRFKAGSEEHDTDLQLGPAPRLSVLGPLAFAFKTGEPRTSTAEVCVGTRPEKDLDPIAMMRGKGKY